MNSTTTTPPLPSGFARTARAFESLSDAEALPLIETAETNPDGEKRGVALSTLGRAGILPPLNWVPLARKPIPASEQVSCFDPVAERKARKITTAPAGSDQDRETLKVLETPAVAAPEITVVAVTPFVEEAKYEAERRAIGKCTPPRERHRYNLGGTCMHCPARDPRKPQGKASLADILKAEKATQKESQSHVGQGIGGDAVGTVPDLVEAPTVGDAERDRKLGVGDDQGPRLPPVGHASGQGTDAAGSGPEGDRPILPGGGGGDAVRADVAAPTASIAATPITTAVSFAEAMGELEVALSPNLSGDDGYAAWVVGKILDRQAQIQRVEAQAREMVAQLHNDLSGLAYRFKQPLQEYARRLIESSGRKGARSAKTLAGTLSFRGGDGCVPTLSVADPERLREWCLEQPDAEQFGAYTFVPDKQKVLAWAKATGEVPRGVEAKAQPEAFYVKSADGVSVNLSKLSAPALPAPDEPEEE